LQQHLIKKLFLRTNHLKEQLGFVNELYNYKDTALKNAVRIERQDISQKDLD